MGWYLKNPSPQQALDEAIFYGFCANTSPLAKPGAVVSRLPAPQRDALQRLTPRDTMRVRTDWLFGPARRRGRFNLPTEKEPPCHARSKKSTS
jgi:hypothetical protein